MSVTNTGQATGHVAVPRQLIGQLEELIEQAYAVDMPPLADQKTMGQLLRTIALLVRASELNHEQGKILFTALLPTAPAGSWRGFVEVVDLWADLDEKVVDWQAYDAGLPPQAVPRQAVATDLAEQDVEAVLWALLNPGDTRCVDCEGRVQQIAVAIPGKEVCEAHLRARQDSVSRFRGLHTVGGAS